MGLPVEEALPDLRHALAEAAAAVLVAPPGTGKTTLVPLGLRDEPWLAGRRIVVLEPRRLATRAAARRMARLLEEEVGGTVGFTTRDERRVGPTTRIEVVTEGVLTRRLQRDRRLGDVGLVVFDEVHERHLMTDLGLALTLAARSEGRPDLRLLAMSATIDAGEVAALLGGAPVLACPGEAHPLEVRWRPGQQRLEVAMAAAVREALAEEAGDVLAFLPGAAEIRRTADALTEGWLPDAVELHVLHGQRPVAEQDAALAAAPPGRRKVVLATDIAESSLTVEGVRIVFDSGVARRPRFDRRTGLTRLTSVAVSRASADQRAGRAGRLGPGVAYRLWSPLDHAARPAHREAEISQVDLAGLALELAAWGAEPDELSWLDAPPARALRAGRALLAELGALDGDGRLTEDGRSMVELPLHPRLAHLVAVGAQAGRGGLACVLATLIDERDVLRGRPDDVPVDLRLRVGLVADPSATHPRADGRAVAAVRARAADLARRVGADLTDLDGDLDAGPTGLLVSLAYPDRIAKRRGSPGHVQLPDGTRAWLPATDPLAAADRLVAVDLDGRRNPRIRLAAPL